MAVTSYGASQETVITHMSLYCQVCNSIKYI